MQEGYIAKRYAQMLGERGPYEDRARASASVTIPSLFPPEGADGTTDLRTPHQAIGARLLNTLASKLLLAELPPNQPFFRYTVDESDIGEVSVETKGQIELALSGLERLTLRYIENRQFQPVLHEAIKQLLAAGNTLLYAGREGFKQYRLDKYVVKRDGMGKVREIIICEPITEEEIPKHMRGIVINGHSNMLSSEPMPSDNDKHKYKLYTRIVKHGNHWVATQEINGHVDPKARSTYPLNRCPYIALRMIRVDGEDYGRGYVEEYLGDLKSLEVLSRALNEGTAAAARILFLVRQNSTTKPKVLTEAPNGGFVPGNEEDVSVLHLEKQADFNVARQRMAEIKEDLSAAFLMNSSLTRNAERVTATEIRAMAQELETVLGGVYSLLSVELQLPLVHVVLGRLQQEGKMPEFPDNTLKPQVLTGIAALGRSQELDKLRLFLEILMPLGEQAIQEGVVLPEFTSRVAAALSIDTKDLVPTQAILDKRKEEQDAKELMSMLGPEAMKMMSGGMPQANL